MAAWTAAVVADALVTLNEERTVLVLTMDMRQIVAIVVSVRLLAKQSARRIVGATGMETANAKIVNGNRGTRIVRRGTRIVASETEKDIGAIGIAATRRNAMELGVLYRQMRLDATVFLPIPVQAMMRLASSGVVLPTKRLVIVYLRY